MVKGQLLAEVTPFASVTWIVKDPTAVGVPVMAPDEGLSASPAGSVPVATEKV
jgi:hypothetical protein